MGLEIIKGETYEVFTTDIHYSDGIPQAYKPYFPGLRKYPVGTLFRCLRINSKSIGFILIIDSVEIRQTGRDDGCTVTIPHGCLRLLCTDIRMLLLMEGLKQ